MSNDNQGPSEGAAPDIFENLGKGEMPPPGFRKPPRAVVMPEPAPGFDWELASWRLLLMLLIAAIWVTYLTCGLLRSCHDWMVRTRASMETRIGKLDGSIPEEIV